MTLTERQCGGTGLCAVAVRTGAAARSPNRRYYVRHIQFRTCFDETLP